MHYLRRRNIDKNHEMTCKKHAGLSFFFRSRSSSETRRANAFYSVNHVVCVHAAFSEKRKTYMLCWLGGKFKDPDKLVKNMKCSPKIKIKSGQVHDKNADMFSDPPRNDILVPTGLPQGAPNDRIHFRLTFFPNLVPEWS